ncbi:beta-1,3-galactosyltransferase 1 [Nothobranchius furzeri]|uniref:Hexosyltransferase n=2 Tax=Nothobranchius TaxID=28779 RepID=A0A8C6M3U9_NOTFU|nr:transcript variant X1 [Nothobranchius furzeri]
MLRLSPGSEKRLWKRVRLSLCFLGLSLLMGTLTFAVYSCSSLTSWPLPGWTVMPLSIPPYKKPTPAPITQEPSGISSPQLPLPQSSFFVAYPHRYHFIVDEPNRCDQESPFLVVIVPVPPHNRDVRNIIRSTWGKHTTVLGQVVSYYFLLGLSSVGDGRQHPEEQILLESQKHHDILQSDFQDSYKNLTIKTMLMFEWISTHCPNTSYAMKIDSDIFFNVHNLVRMLLKAPRHLYMTGLVVRNAQVLRDPNSKWFVPSAVFPESTYPPYPMGLGYVFSLDLPRRILEVSTHIRAIYIEDVHVGLCMRHLGIALTDPPRGGLFVAAMPQTTSQCYWVSVITTMLWRSEQLLDVWKTYENQTQSDC